MRRGQVEAAQNEFQGAVQHKAAGNAGATPVPDVDAAETHLYTLNANTTVAAPVLQGAAITGSNVPPVGWKLFLSFVQDATGTRTLAWNAIYRGAPATTGGAATAGQRMSCEYRWDGASWQFVGGATTFA